MNALALLTTSADNAKLAYYDTETALDHFEQTGATEYMARSLRLGSRLLRLTGDHDGARRDLDQAQYLAGTYDFKLVLVDCLIEKAELLLADSPRNHADARTVLASAKSLVQSTDYHRRASDICALETRLG